MIRGITRSGFEFEISEDIANDMELFDALCELKEGDLTAISAVCRMILGDQKKALYEHLRDENGRVPVTRVEAEIAEIFNLMKDGKK